MELHSSVNLGKPRSLGNVIPSRPLLSGFEWPDSLWFNIAVAAIVGLLYALYLLGPKVLNPLDISWLHDSDAATYYTGWALFRQDPHLHWPLTFTDRIGYPIGQSISLMDVNPLLALLLKALSPLLPSPFQYLGLEAILACALQFFFALRLFRLVSGPNLLGVLLPSIFFLVAPPMTLRMGAHYTLTNQWLLTAALFVFCVAHRKQPISTKRFIAMTLTLAAIAVAINPYLAFQVLAVLGAAIAGLLWCRRLPLTKALSAFAALAATSIASAYFFGFVVSGGQEYGTVGYRLYSFNLLAPFDPNAHGSLFLHPLPHYTPGQYEGYCYLGAGVIFLGVIVAFIALTRMSTLLKSDLFRLHRRPIILLVLCCLVLTLMACSTEVSIGSKLLVDLDPGQKLSPYLATLRSSARLFWTPYYVVLLVALAGPYLLANKRWAGALLAAALAIQLADLHPLQERVHAVVNTPQESELKSPIWHRLGASYQNLIVMPPYQCDPSASPGKDRGFLIFGMLAAEQKMRTNSYNSGRYTKAGQDFHCVTSLSTLLEHPLSAASVYVVTPPIAIRLSKSSLGKCGDLDGFTLCAGKDDLGLPPGKWESEKESWVHRHFRIILSRDPTPEELTKWIDVLDHGSKSPADFMDDLLGSTEFKHNSLTRFSDYLHSHGHAPRLDEWLQDSPAPSNAHGRIESQQPVQDRNRAIVSIIYFAVLERAADPGGLDDWSKVLSHTSIQFVVSQLLNSPEYKSHKNFDYR